MKLNMANFGACITKIKERGRLTDGEAKAILQETATRAEGMRRTGVKDPFVAAAGDLAAKLKEQAQLDHDDAIRNAEARQKVMADVKQAGGISGAVRVLRSMLHGTNRGSRESIESTWKGVASGWQAALSSKLHRAGVEKAAISGAIDRDVAREIWDMRKVGPSKPGAVTGNNPARTIAEAIMPALNNARDRLNAAGGRVADAVDYVAHTEHDPRKMRAAGGPGKTPTQAFEAWWKAEQPRWSEETFKDLVPRDGESMQQARDRFGRSVFDSLVSGIHMTPDGALGVKAPAPYVPPAFEGSRNVAKSVSQPRLIRYRDADAWYEHQKQFGSSTSLTAGIMATLDRSARQVALMDRLGTHPTANFNQVIRKIQEEYRSDLDGLAKFKGKIGSLNNVMGRLDGSLNIPENEMWARIGNTTRTMETMSSLGGVGITHFASIWPTVTSEMVHHGVPRLQTLGNMVAALVRGKGSAERQEIMADLGAYSASLSRDMFSRWQPDDNMPGKVSSLANTFMKYTGIHYVFDNTQAAVREMLAHQLGRSTGIEHGALNPSLSQILGKYGIGKGEWDLLRNVGNLPTSEGRAYLTPKDAGRVDPAAAEALLRARGEINDKTAPEAAQEQVERFTRGLSDKLSSYYTDAANHAVVTPGVRQRAMLLGATRPGSLGGELLRFVTQFKVWPLAAMHQIIGREIFTSLSKGQAAWNIGTLMALSTAAGYFRMSVNDVATGKPIRNPLDWKTGLAALAQGGGVGILGDFLFGETNRMGGGLVSTLMGPVASDADTLIQMFSKFRNDLHSDKGHANGKFADLWPDLAHFAVRHVPFANLVYLKGTLDYMLWYHLFSAASPGWWERTNRRLEREQGRPMMGYSPGGGVPYGVPGIYLQNQAGQKSGLIGQFFNQ